MVESVLDVCVGCDSMYNGIRLLISLQKNCFAICFISATCDLAEAAI